MSDKVFKIAPSILAADFGCLAGQVEEAQAAGADWIHIDIMDGRFVPAITMGPLAVEAVAKVATVPLDVHLMIVEPEHYVQQFADSGAGIISVHVEACRHLHRVLGQIADAGCGAGVALNPHSPASAIGEVMDMLQLINVMTVNPGFGGQRFIDSTLSKIRSLRRLVDKLGADIDIEVDGGINRDTIGSAISAGASVAVAGTCVFQHEGGIAVGMAELGRAAANALNGEDDD